MREGPRECRRWHFSGRAVSGGQIIGEHIVIQPGEMSKAQYGPPATHKGLIRAPQSFVSTPSALKTVRVSAAASLSGCLEQSQPLGYNGNLRGIFGML